MLKQTNFAYFKGKKKKSTENFPIILEIMQDIE